MPKSSDDYSRPNIATINGFYLRMLLRQYFGAGAEEDGDGRAQFYREIVQELDRQGWHAAAIAFRTSTIHRWLKGNGLINAKQPQLPVAITVISRKITDEDERRLTIERLKGLKELPIEIQEAYRKNAAEKHGVTVQYAGNLISSAVRSWNVLFDTPPDTADYKRAKEELDAFNYMFQDRLTIQEFSSASAQVIHRRSDPEFQSLAFNYAINRLVERPDLSLDIKEESWRGSFAASARVLLQAAQLSQAVSRGSDHEILELGNRLKDRLFKAMLVEQDSAFLNGLALCLFYQTRFEYPPVIPIQGAEYESLIRYIRRPAHHPLTLRAVLLLASKAAPFHEALTSSRTIEYLALCADDPRQYLWRDFGPVPLAQPTQTQMSYKLADLIKKYDSWLVRYPLLTFAYRHRLVVPGLHEIADEILEDNQASDTLRSDAICYLARTADPASRQLLLRRALSDEKDWDRAFTAIIGCGTCRDLQAMLAEMSPEYEYGREAILNALMMRFPLKNLWQRVYIALSLKRLDRDQLIKKLNEMRCELAAEKLEVPPSTATGSTVRSVEGPSDL